LEYLELAVIPLDGHEEPSKEKIIKSLFSWMERLSAAF
jgi:hypothetical protein